MGGSKINNKVGCGFVVVKLEIIEHRQCRISDENTVYQAELYAIFMAVEYIINNDMSDTHIYSYSRSALQAISQNILLHKIKCCILNFKHSISLHWVKAHAGNIYNDQVDHLVKEAVEREQPDAMFGYTKTQVKRLSMEDCLKSWQERWNCSDKGRWTYSLITKVSTKRCVGDFYMNQLFINHGVFNSYQSRFFHKDSNCECGQGVGDIKHIVYYCINFNSVREQFFPYNFISLNVYDLIKTCKARQDLYIIISTLLSKLLEFDR
jgi:ribonuclease HI